MERIFDYIDYRSFLRDFYSVNKSEKKYFSYRYFSGRAGIKSPVFLKLVMDGKRNLTRNMVEKFATALKFNEKERVYFRNLVLFNQAQNSQEKQEHYLVLKSMAGMVKEHVIGSDLYDYYDKWYISVIRELICLRNFKDDFRKIASAVFPKIRPMQAKKALELLLRLGLVRKIGDGSYEQTQKAITTGSEVNSLAIRNFNRNMLLLAENSLDKVSRSNRHISGITVGISGQCYHVLTAEIEAFKERVVKIVNADEKSENVYQLNLQLFPLNRIDGGF